MILLYFTILSFNYINTNVINTKNKFISLQTLSKELDNDFSQPGDFASMEEMSQDKGSQPKKKRSKRRQHIYTYGRFAIPAKKIRVSNEKFHRFAHNPVKILKVKEYCIPQCMPTCRKICSRNVLARRRLSHFIPITRFGLRRRGMQPIYPTRETSPAYARMSNPFASPLEPAEQLPDYSEPTEEVLEKENVDSSNIPFPYYPAYDDSDNDYYNLGSTYLAPDYVVNAFGIHSIDDLNLTALRPTDAPSNITSHDKTSNTTNSNKTSSNSSTTPIPSNSSTKHPPKEDKSKNKTKAEHKSQTVTKKPEKEPEVNHTFPVPVEPDDEATRKKKATINIVLGVMIFLLVMLIIAICVCIRIRKDARVPKTSMLSANRPSIQSSMYGRTIPSHVNVVNPRKMKRTYNRMPREPPRVPRNTIVDMTKDYEIDNFVARVVQNLTNLNKVTTLTSEEIDEYINDEIHAGEGRSFPKSEAAEIEQRIRDRIDFG
ncbi:hypothetical protein SNEBB_007807 [Seison nebaliae]|nr:hypothetical protein SNEBB_007807 [Seison nebaliae]